MTTATAASIPENRRIARVLEQIGDLLEQQRANEFRVKAYRDAAVTVRASPRAMSSILREEGLDGLDRLPTIGAGLAHIIEQCITRGEPPMLDRLRGRSTAEHALSAVPGVGHTLAARAQEAGIVTLEQLEQAAHDGSLARVRGFGAKRIAGIRDALATRLAQRAPRRHALDASPAIPVEELLAVDREYTDSDAAGVLPRIAPRRFNRTRERWLPVLHTTRGAHHHTALYSNTARAHELGKVKDWVVVYTDGPDGEQQHTVVTASRGPLLGRRVVRGREAECAEYYAEAR